MKLWRCSGHGLMQTIKPSDPPQCALCSNVVTPVCMVEVFCKEHPEGHGTAEHYLEIGRKQGRSSGYAEAERDIVAYFEAQTSTEDSIEYQIMYGVFALVAKVVRRKKHRKAGA